jgi:hypothetical protein
MWRATISVYSRNKIPVQYGLFTPGDPDHGPDLEQGGDGPEDDAIRLPCHWVSGIFALTKPVPQGLRVINYKDPKLNVVFTGV